MYAFANELLYSCLNAFSTELLYSCFYVFSTELLYSCLYAFSTEHTLACMHSQLNCYTLACMHSRVNCYTPACMNSRANSFISTCMHSRANRYTPASLYVFSIEQLYFYLYGFSKRLYSCNPAVGSCMWTQKLKSHLVRTQSLNVFPLKPGVGQYIAIHATLTARDFVPC